MLLHSEFFLKKIDVISITTLALGFFIPAISLIVFCWVLLNWRRFAAQVDRHIDDFLELNRWYRILYCVCAFVVFITIILSLITLIRRMIVLDKEVFLEAMRLLNAKTDELLSLQKAWKEKADMVESQRDLAKRGYIRRFIHYVRSFW